MDVMIRQNHYKSQLGGIAKSIEWRIFDALLLRQIADDLELIEEHGDASFVDYMRPHVDQVLFAEQEANRRGFRWLVLGPIAALANRLGWKGNLAETVFAWRQYREPLRRIAAEVRDEAERIRNADNCRQAVRA